MPERRWLVLLALPWPLLHCHSCHLLDVVYHLEELSLCTHLALTPKCESSHAFVLGGGEDRFDCAHMTTVELVSKRCVQLPAHAFGCTIGSRFLWDSRLAPIWIGRRCRLTGVAGRSTRPNRNPPKQSAPFIHPPSDRPWATAWYGKVQFQTAKWFGQGLIQFDDYVIGGQVVDGEEGDSRVRVVGTERRPAPRPNGLNLLDHIEAL